MLVCLKRKERGDDVPFADNKSSGEFVAEEPPLIEQTLLAELVSSKKQKQKKFAEPTGPTYPTTYP